ncbi:sodium-dependent bicarbonate transport family permease [Rhodoferax sp. TBRC 17198]|uniref:sodium-dependent bicarbonate transport family permease n=1 Tax=Rhodoferax potami TaxID=3068338 RepID=UPI0028BDB9F2|nr:sodium-dependent bicarbonate transport family permease [Rhodoferax sp. TBRC 17198]MDT7523444.1 sodium-dependent bicarbonate transport family permease [Rhodoferax sp. TBRC 17198]
MQALLDPAILFFLLGLTAGFLKSNLEIPPQVSRFLALYLLMALGLKGGFALSQSGFGSEVGLALGLALLLAVIIPALSFLLMRRLIAPFDAAAVAATYGSVSAVTFITAIQYLEGRNLAFGGHMAAAMALMESPAIIFAIALASKMRSKLAVQPGPQQVAPMGFKGVLHESLTDGAQFLLLGSIAIGLLTGQEGKLAMEPFTGNLFKGMLAFFLLDMGVSAAKNLPKLRGQTPWIYVYALSAPLVHAALALVLGYGLGIKAGDLALLMVLAASASYIAVPAVLKHSMPEANSALYLGMSLGITLPLNLVIGIPLYVYVAFRVAGA